MILFIEPISNNPGMYVPAYPLPLLEIASYIKANIPGVPVQVVSIPMDYGLPLDKKGKQKVYQELMDDLRTLKPKGIGISCTAISQAEEVIHLCNLIKTHDPDIFIFLGGYFPTIYYEEILFRTSAVDLIVRGEGEESALKIAECLHRGENPISDDIPNLAWNENGQVRLTPKGAGFDLNQKALLNLRLLKHPAGYDILPYAFSRGCPYRCYFCMEDRIRPHRKEVPIEIIGNDLANLMGQIKARTLLVSDALFKSFNVFPLVRSLGLKVNFETRCDVLDPSLIPQIADVCGAMALGLESASYRTLRRMNKVRDRSHYQRYISNAMAIFKEAAHHEIPMMVFMIAGYPGDTEEDLAESLAFAEALSKNKGPGGHVFKIGECHVYPKTKIYDLAVSLPEVVFDDDGVFGQNIVRQPSKDVNFQTVLDYSREIFRLSHYTPKLQKALLNIMPFFRLPTQALTDDIIPDRCFQNHHRTILNVRGESLSVFRDFAPDLALKYKEMMSMQRKTRVLNL